MCKIGIAGEDVIGKEVGSSPGISHSPPMTILISVGVAGFRPLPAQVVYISMVLQFGASIFTAVRVAAQLEVVNAADMDDGSRFKGFGGDAASWFQSLEGVIRSHTS